VDQYEGVAKYIKPDKALLHLAHKTRQGAYEKFVLNGRTAYEWDASTKVVRIHQTPAPKNGQLADDNNFLSIIFNLKASDARARYQMRLMPRPPEDKGDWYQYIEVLPRSKQDQAEFTRARLVLTLKTGMPRQLWFQEPNGTEVTWDFANIYPNVQVDPNEFNRPTTLEAGWQFQAAAPQQPEGPLKVRSKSP